MKTKKKMTADEAKRAVAAIGKTKSKGKKLNPNFKPQKLSDRLKIAIPGSERPDFEDD